MDRLISCEFNMDTACVELKFLDGSMIAMDTIAVDTIAVEKFGSWKMRYIALLICAKAY